MLWLEEDITEATEVLHPLLVVEHLAWLAELSLVLAKNWVGWWGWRVVCRSESPLMRGLECRLG